MGKSFFLAKLDELNKMERSCIKKANLIHLFVISGLHISVILVFCSVVVNILTNSLYSMRVITSFQRFQLRLFGSVFTSLLLLVYSVLVGGTISVQRAFCSHLVSYLAWVAHHPQGVGYRVLYGVFFQILFFPLGFFSITNLISWTFYIYLVLHSKDQGLLSYVKIQAGMAMISLGYFGKISLLSFGVNLIFIPVLPVIFVLILGSSLFKTNWDDGFMQYLFEVILYLNQFLLLNSELILKESWQNNAILLLISLILGVSLIRAR